jgi:hypothetical protein
MKAKAQRLGSDRPLEKVDSSSWTPAELLNADVKTGLRPISKRQFKKGGKVTGKATVARADRKARKSGGRALSADSLINRDVREANEQREGKKHVGGFKKGGRTGKLSGGALERYLDKAQDDRDDTENAMRGRFSRNSRRDRAAVQMGDDRIARRDRGISMAERKLAEKGMKKGGAAKRKGYANVGAVDEIAEFLKNDTTPAVAPKGPMTKGEAGVKTGGGTEAERAANRAAFDKAQQEYQRSLPQNRKAGGRAKKAGGGDAEQFGPGVAGAADMMKKAAGRAGVPGGLYGAGFQRVGAGKLSPMSATGMSKLKKGGKVAKVSGSKGKHRFARGGRAGCDTAPYSSAHVGPSGTTGGKG